MRSQRRYEALATFVLVGLGPVLALATFAVLGPLDQGVSSNVLRFVILADLVYILVIATLVLQRVAQMIAARRARSAGSRLHLRLTGVFAAIALVPTVLVAVFAMITVNFGLEGWFSERVQRVVGTSLSAAEAYEGEQRQSIVQDAEGLGAALDLAGQASAFLSDGDLRQMLTQGQSRIQRGLREAYLVDSSGALRVRGERSYLFDFEKPTTDEIERALSGETVLIQDWVNDEFRVLISLSAFVDRLLYVSREVDGEILTLLDETQETIAFYQQLESERGRLLFEFGLLYLGFAVILILAAIWLGLWFAERLARPIGRLAGAAQRVGSGDFNAKVAVGASDDEVTMLGRSFNQMTTQLNAQREALMTNTRELEERQRLIDSVLGSVTAGVIGLDADGKIDFVNTSAHKLLHLGREMLHGKALEDHAPEFIELFQKLQTRRRNTAQEELRVTRRGQTESLLVRMARRLNTDGAVEGTVIAFDDVTDLVSAQRMAAWGDVARRIAHEIKNPLTPIQLSAERLKRKFTPIVGDQAEALAELTGVIVRQTGDLRRIVDEFSKFARMPEPERRNVDIVELVRDSVVLQQSGQVGVNILSDLPSNALMADLDSTLMGQALTNLIKNAGEAIESRQENGDRNFQPEIRVKVSVVEDALIVTVSDNGIGLPEDVSSLFEPYVTTRDKGTGLGLPIVRKIIEEHDGTLMLSAAEPFSPAAHRGAMAKITLPLPPDQSAAA
jgi:two-component system, NtrC family, nitrogen regulation sensor histidine kinase NtrY